MIITITENIRKQNISKKIRNYQVVDILQKLNKKKMQNKEQSSLYSRLNLFKIAFHPYNPLWDPMQYKDTEEKIYTVRVYTYMNFMKKVFYAYRDIQYVVITTQK